MSRTAAIYSAVHLQIAADGIELKNTQKLSDNTDVYKDKSAVQLFLHAVANRLRSDAPPLNFNWTDLDPAQAGSMDLVVLIAHIEAHTEFLDED
ncbi:hypothetical protein [Hoeflea poritis]|uniref:Uncharacterized protein n=1 Tax=Hoeflea poritis TaxID=2993659 RepID=A0ABT4VN50_9HYPH|nr:hypothetical protein [Hoeflea poritis]MDA4846133.1 hypothetical protein [Hoeflea poritis]